MPPIPQWLKHALLPAWNGGHRLAWRLGELLGALAHRRFGRCAVCGRWGPFLYRRWVIRPELERRAGVSAEVAEAWARKESSDCSFCGAKLRARRIAEVLLRLVPSGEGPPLRSIRQWVRSPQARRLVVAEVNEVEGLHRELLRLPGLRYSEFREGAAPGSVVDGVPSETLERLSYDDASIDLMISSETLEHVPDLDAALVEIRRVLRPGGRHVFTVPMLPGVPETFRRATLLPDGSVEPLGPMVCHPGGDWGYPVFTEIGADFPERLRRAGFEVDVFFGPVRPEDVCQVFSCRKPSEPTGSTGQRSDQFKSTRPSSSRNQDGSWRLWSRPAMRAVL
ncbi:class I SAM-dependent methyltransferase [Tautonia sociabilis]|uniref:SAM-dependent methyltransferase n=1 Tax=Tautonia sociabilis TaxID=2080755 RepID=A0A432MHV4_9BACT|nr:class I SAM-dependent methyltransferase [Tautonia sociabilis]RUL86942.1 SAM-dependent methyltransferase [Tautonia sociabilis]